MAATWTLSQIQTKVRQLIGRFSSAEISNSELVTRINQYYTLTFPAEVKLETKHVYYQFTTSANQPYYDVPQTTYTNFEPPATCNNLMMYWFQDPAYFFQANPLQYTFLTPWTGDGSTTAFTTTITGFPIYPGTTTIYDGVELFEDTNQTYTTANVTVTGSLGGAMVLNYSTGVISVTFNTAPADGQNINLNYVIFAAQRPQAILLYNNQFQLWPVPDQAYIIKMRAWGVVDALVNATDTPQLNEWGPTIAFGTARQIAADYGEMDAYAQLTVLYKEQLGYILTRTMQEMMSSRAPPTF